MAARFLKIATVYFVLAIILGIVMGISHVFAYASVHAHLNLAGWVTLAIIGLIYKAYPQAAGSRLANWHFWLHNLGLPVMQGSLFLMILTGTESFVVGAIIGSLVLGIGILFFAINVWKHVTE
ncbi:cytochrome-c oxidase [Brevibacillus nitrificans]|uniref:cytochrome-c oxidase n=1 Tax=Brevibacillus nitrificans TaxID=651560 RepID=UPI0028627B86|nr:cytochrome-c oxidase [Brevibacillus nitrificans]MDR7313883.1 cbb3-type cytochrome oxidase subunit 1 [Brevibacillus nitrificans]